MIQELLGGGSSPGVFLAAGERSSSSPKLSTAGVLLESSPSPSPSPSPSSSSNIATPTSSSTTSENLRCPRCDSSNTKFCYYNNYNLTQPRHFCKTCRRYWTKGGALRNVPIGGGCRKNKNTSFTTSVGKSATGKLIKTVSPEVGKPSLFGGFEHEINSNPILWASPQNSHLLSLLRANPNPNPSPVSVKEESVIYGSIMSSEPSVALSARTVGLDPLSQIPCTGSLWKNNQLIQAGNNPLHQQNGVIVGEIQSTGLQELYQRLRSSTNYFQDHSPLLLGNVTSSSSSPSATVLETSPLAAGDQLGYWNQSLSWTDLQTSNGAYP